MKHLCLSLALLLALTVSTATAGPIMYVDDTAGVLGTVDVATGAVTVIGNMGVVMTDIAFDPSGNLYGVTFTQLFSIDKTTAASMLIGDLGFAGANALVFGMDGTLYTAGFNTTNLYTVNTTTGNATSLGDMGFMSAGDLAFHGGDFYLASTANSLVKIDLGDITQTSEVGAFGVPNMFGLATGSDGILYGVAGTNVYTVDTATGAASNPVSFAGNGLGAAHGQSFFEEAGAVPEPSTLLLVGGGLIAALRTARRRRTA